MDQIFLAVQKRIIDRVPEIKWVDFDFGQLDAYEMRPPVLFPCALIDIELPDIEDEGKDKQICSCSVTLRLAFEQPGQTNSKTPKPIMDKAMTVFAGLRKVFLAVHGLQGPDFGKLKRRSLLTEKREDPLKVFKMRFECNLTDHIVIEKPHIKLAPVVIVETT